MCSIKPLLWFKSRPAQSFPNSFHFSISCVLPWLLTFPLRTHLLVLFKAECVRHSDILTTILTFVFRARYSEVEFYNDCFWVWGWFFFLIVHFSWYTHVFWWSWWCPCVIWLTLWHCVCNWTFSTHFFFLFFLPLTTAASFALNLLLNLCDRCCHLFPLHVLCFFFLFLFCSFIVMSM